MTSTSSRARHRSSDRSGDRRTERSRDAASPPGGETRDARKARTRRALLDAALERLAEESFTSLSLREVAKGAGIVPTAFYRHFPDMDALGIALVDESIGALHELLRDARDSAADNAHLVRSSLGILVEHVHDHRAHFRFLARERAGGSATLRHAISREVRLFATELAVDLARIPEIGAWPSADIQLMADLLVIVIVATIEALLDADGEAAVDAVVDAAAAQMMLVLLGIAAWDPSARGHRRARAARSLPSGTSPAPPSLRSPAMELWHNPRCSKSRAAKALLDERGTTYVERRYLDDPPTVAELDEVLTAMGREPWEVARMGEGRAKELGLRELAHDRDAWLEVLVANPVLIERPVLVTDDGRAAIGRPLEDLEALL